MATLDECFEQASRQGHVMQDFLQEETLGCTHVASCVVCGRRMFRYMDGEVLGPALLVACHDRTPRST